MRQPVADEGMQASVIQDYEGAGGVSCPWWLGVNRWPCQLPLFCAMAIGRPPHSNVCGSVNPGEWRRHDAGRGLVPAKEESCVLLNKIETTWRGTPLINFCGPAFSVLLVDGENHLYDLCALKLHGRWVVASLRGFGVGQLRVLFFVERKIGGDY